MSQFLSGSRPVTRLMGERIADGLKLESDERLSLLDAIAVDQENLKKGETIPLKSSLGYFDGTWIGRGEIKYYGLDKIHHNSIAEVWNQGSSILDIEEEGVQSRFLITSRIDPDEPNFLIHTVESKGVVWSATGYFEGNYFQTVTVTPEGFKFIQTFYLLSASHYVLIGTKLNAENRIIVNYRRTMKRVSTS